MFKYSNHDQVLGFAISELKTYLPQAGIKCPDGSDTVWTRVSESLETIDRLAEGVQREKLRSYVFNTMKDRYETVDLADWHAAKSFDQVAGVVKNSPFMTGATDFED